MTVSSATNRYAYAGDGSTVLFSYPRRFLAAGDLTVLLVSSAGVETTQTLTTDYTVSGAGDEGGGSVTMVTAPAVGQTLLIFSDPAIVQETDYVGNDPFPAETHEDALDLLTMIAQRTRDLINRAVKVPEAEGTGLIIAPVSERASKFLAFGPSGGLIYVTSASGATLDLPIAASDVTLADAGGYWAAETVEAWSQEMGALLPAGDIVGTTDTQTLTGKTLTAPVLNGDLTGTGILNDDTFGTATSLTAATSLSIREYVKSQLLTIGLQEIITHDFATDGGTFVLIDITEDDNDLEIDLEGVSATTLTIEYSTNNGSSWGTPLTLGTSMSTESGVLLVRGIADSARKTIAQMTYGDNSTAAASVVRLDASAAVQNALRIKTLTAGKLYARRIAGSAVALSDPFWDDTVFLLQGGFVENQGNLTFPDFTDLSQAARTINPSGGADGSEEIGVITGSSINVRSDGVDDYITFDHDTDTDPGAGPFTWDIAVLLNSLTTTGTLFAAWGSSSSDFSHHIGITTAGEVQLVYRTSAGGADNTITWAAGLVTGQVYTISVVISGAGSVSCWVDGEQVGEAVALAAAIVAYTEVSYRIGSLHTGGNDLDANINRVRMTRAARDPSTYPAGLFLTR